MTDSSGTISDTYQYQGFGSLLASTGATPNNYLFAGEQLDPGLGFYYLRARYYAPDGGRFITRDPFRGFSNDPLSQHKYLYANANPITFVDPTGHSPIAVAALAVVSGILAVIMVAISVLSNATAGDFTEGTLGLRTNVFEFKTCPGVTGALLYGGTLQSVVIREKNPKIVGRRAEPGEKEPLSAHYTVTSQGFGGSIGLASSGEPVVFKTTKKRSIDSFEGYGSYSNFGASAYVFGGGLEYWKVPGHNEYINTSSKPQFGGGGGLGFGGYSATNVLFQFSELIKSGALACPLK